MDTATPTPIPAAPGPELNHKQLKALAKASRPWYAKKRFWALGGAGLIVILIVAGGGSGSSKPGTKQNGGVSTVSDNSKNPPQADVTIDKCGTDALGGLAQATVRITNHSSGRSDYMVSVNFLDASGTKVGEGTAISNNVDPGQQAVDTAGDVATSAPASCKVVSVDRFASH